MCRQAEIVYNDAKKEKVFEFSYFFIPLIFLVFNKKYLKLIHFPLFYLPAKGHAIHIPCNIHHFGAFVIFPHFMCWSTLGRRRTFVFHLYPLFSTLSNLWFIENCNILCKTKPKIQSNKFRRWMILCVSYAKHIYKCERKKC